MEETNKSKLIDTYTTNELVSEIYKLSVSLYDEEKKATEDILPAHIYPPTFQNKLNKLTLMTEALKGRMVHD